MSAYNSSFADDDTDSTGAEHTLASTATMQDSGGMATSTNTGTEGREGGEGGYGRNGGRHGGSEAQTDAAAWTEAKDTSKGSTSLAADWSNVSMGTSSGGRSNPSGSNTFSDMFAAQQDADEWLAGGDYYPGPGRGADGSSWDSYRHPQGNNNNGTINNNADTSIARGNAPHSIAITADTSQAGAWGSPETNPTINIVQQDSQPQMQQQAINTPDLIVGQTSPMSVASEPVVNVGFGSGGMAFGGAGIKPLRKGTHVKSFSTAEKKSTINDLLGEHKTRTVSSGNNSHSSRHLSHYSSGGWNSLSIYGVGGADEVDLRRFSTGHLSDGQNGSGHSSSFTVNMSDQNGKEEYDSASSLNGSIWTEKATGRRRRKGGHLENAVNSVSSANRLSTGTSISLLIPAGNSQSPSNSTQTSPTGNRSVDGLFVVPPNNGSGGQSSQDLDQIDTPHGSVAKKNDEYRDDIDDTFSDYKSGIHESFYHDSKGKTALGADVKNGISPEDNMGIGYDGRNNSLDDNPNDALLPGMTDAEIKKAKAQRWKPLALFFAAISALCLLLAGIKFNPMTAFFPPLANRIPQTFLLGGMSFKDDYYWIRETIFGAKWSSYLDSEAGWTSQFMGHVTLKALRTNLEAELQRSTNSIGSYRGPCSDYASYGGDFWSEGNYFYWKETSKLKPYPIYHRRKLYDSTRSVRGEEDKEDASTSPTSPFYSRTGTNKLAKNAEVCGCPIGPEHVILDLNEVVKNLQFIPRPTSEDGKKKKKKDKYSYVEEDEVFMYELDIKMYNDTNSKDLKDDFNPHYKRKYLRSDLEVAENGFFHEGIFEVDPQNDNLVAFSFDNFGSEKYTLFIKNVVDGTYSTGIPNTHLSARWMDSKLLVNSLGRTMGIPTEILSITPIGFDSIPKVSETDLVWKRSTGPKLVKGEIDKIYEDKTKKYIVDLVSTTDNKFIMIQSSNLESNELLMVKKSKEITTTSTVYSVDPIFKRETGVQYTMAHQAGRFFIRSNVDYTPISSTKEEIKCEGYCIFMIEEQNILDIKGQLTLSEFLSGQQLSSAKTKRQEIVADEEPTDESLTETTATATTISEAKETTEVKTTEEATESATSEAAITSSTTSEEAPTPTETTVEKPKDDTPRKDNGAILIFPSMKSTTIEEILTLEEYLCMWVRRDGVREFVVFGTKNLDELIKTVKKEKDQTKNMLEKIKTFGNGEVKIDEAKIDESERIYDQKSLITGFDGKILKFATAEDVYSEEETDNLNSEAGESPLGQNKSSMVYSVGGGFLGVVNGRTRVLYNADCMVFTNSSIDTAPVTYSLDLQSIRPFMLVQEFVPALDELSTTGERIIPERTVSADEEPQKVIKNKFTTKSLLLEESEAFATVNRIKNGQFTVNMESFEGLTIASSGSDVIPMSIAYESKVHFPAPVVMTVKSSSKINPDDTEFDEDMKYSPEDLSLISRGIVLIVCHARGGTVNGRIWEKEGLDSKRINSILDVEACAKELVSRGISVKGRMALRAETGLDGVVAGFLAGSLGWNPGTTRGYFTAVTTRDAIMDPILAIRMPLPVGTSVEELEVGESKRPTDFVRLEIESESKLGNPLQSLNVKTSMIEYSPYNLLLEAEAHLHRKSPEKQEDRDSLSDTQGFVDRLPYVPALYMEAGSHNVRVPMWQSVRYSAMVRALTAPRGSVIGGARHVSVVSTMSDHSTVLQVTKRGHFDTSITSQKLKEKAKVLAFLVYNMNIYH